MSLVWYMAVQVWTTHGGGDVMAKKQAGPERQALIAILDALNTLLANLPATTESNRVRQQTADASSRLRRNA